MLFLNENKNKLGLVFFLVIITFTLGIITMWKFLPSTKIDFVLEKNTLEEITKEGIGFKSDVSDNLELGLLKFNSLKKEFDRMHKQEILIKTTKEYLSNLSTSTEE